MISLSLQGLSKSFGVHTILKDATFAIEQGAKVGLVGVNGSGKSTLLRIIAGLEPYDGGELSFARGTRIGYLAQQDMTLPDATVWQTLESIYEPTFQMEKRLRDLEAEIALRHDDEQAFHQLSTDYDRLLQRFEEADGYAWKSMILGVLNGLGFSPAQYDRPVDSLSGGERTRLCLARMLLQKPDLLLLDEPTNHLDMASLEWLQTTLNASRSTVLIVSHDRYFLDHVCTDIVELMSGSCESYNGNYTRYLELRQERYETRLRTYELQQKEIERQQAIIARYRMYNREKSIRAAESREKALARMEKVEKPDQERSIRLCFRAAKRTGEDVLLVEGLSKSYGEKQLFSGLNLHVRSGERVAIIGPNGVGKTTLLRVLMGQEQRDAGTFRFGANVQIGYYDQQQSGLHPEKTVLDEVWDRFPQMEQSDVRGALGMFLFSGDDVFQPIHTLSGGEKGRVSLTSLMLGHDNVLILDEPTNHLDMDSREALEDALCDYDGTILTVSHDRYFINRIADRIVEMQPDGVTVYLGNYESYLEKKNAPQEEVFLLSKTRTQAEKEKRQDRLGRQAIKQRKARVQEIEQIIEKKETEICEMEIQLSDPALYADADRAQSVRLAYKTVQEDLALLYQEWEKLDAAL